MSKLLIVVGVLAVAVWWFWGRRSGRGQDDARRPPPVSPRLPQTIQACAHCGVHVPEGEAVQDEAGRTYCGDAHRRLGPRP